MKNRFKIGIAILIGCIKSISSDGQNTEVPLWDKFIYESPKITFAQKYGLAYNEVAHFDISAFTTAEDDEIQHLQLPPIIALQMGDLRAKYYKAKKALPDSRSFGKAKQWEIEEIFRNSLKSLIGDEKFIEWFNYMGDKIKRHFKNEYGFTDEHFQIYQDIENRYTIDIQRIQSSAIPKELKSLKIQRAKEIKIECLKTLLPKEQFTKWYNSHQD